MLKKMAATRGALAMGQALLLLRSHCLTPHSTGRGAHPHFLDKAAEAGRVQGPAL